jgi:hypothetical protein
MSLLDDLRKSVIDGELNATQDQVNKALAEIFLPKKSSRKG